MDKFPFDKTLVCFTASCYVVNVEERFIVKVGQFVHIFYFLGGFGFCFVMPCFKDKMATNFARRSLEMGIYLSSRMWSLYSRTV